MTIWAYHYRAYVNFLEHVMSLSNVPIVLCYIPYGLF
jgi:hypothetical protein